MSDMKVGLVAGGVVTIASTAYGLFSLDRWWKNKKRDRAILKRIKENKSRTIQPVTYGLYLDIKSKCPDLAMILDLIREDEYSGVVPNKDYPDNELKLNLGWFEFKIFKKGGRALGFGYNGSIYPIDGKLWDTLKEEIPNLPELEVLLAK